MTADSPWTDDPAKDLLDLVTIEHRWNNHPEPDGRSRVGCSCGWRAPEMGNRLGQFRDHLTDALAPRVAELQRAAQVEALTEFSRELHDRAGDLNGPRKNEAWFCSDRALNRADQIERGAL